MKAILVVEDDAATRTLLEHALSEVDGWVVTAVEDGAKVLEVLNTVQPNLIVLDINMPGLSGLEVYRLLRDREDLSDVPVLFVSAETPVNINHLKGPYRSVTKPFSVDDLIAVAAGLLGLDVPTE